MAGEDESGGVVSFMAEQFRRLNARFDKFELEIVDLKMRASSVDEHLAGIMISVSGINNRLDRIDERVGRIERRLDLTEAK